MTGEVVKIRQEANLVYYDAAKKALAQCVKVDEVKEIRDKSIALATYAAQAKDAELEVNAREIRLRAERRLGQMMAEQPKAKGGGEKGVGRRGNAGSEQPHIIPTLADAGIDKNLAKRARELASLTENTFEKRLDNIRVKMESAPEGMSEIRREFGITNFEREKKKEDINVVANRQRDFFDDELSRERSMKLKDLVKFRKDLEDEVRIGLGESLRKYAKFLVACADKLEEGV